MKFITRLIDSAINSALTSIQRAGYLFDAPYYDGSGMLAMQMRIDDHEHDVTWWELGYICEDFDRDGYCFVNFVVN